MVSCQPFEVAGELVEVFQRDGAVVVKGVLDASWRVTAMNREKRS